MAKAALEEKAIRVIGEYMMEQNRPYSAIDVYNNMRQEYGKTLVIKALEQGVSQDLLKEKIISKQKIFYVNQDKLPQCDEAALKELDKEIVRKSETLSSLSAKYKTLKSELAALRSSETTAQLRISLQEGKKVCTEMRARLRVLESSRDTAGEEEARKLLAAQASMEATARKRKRMAYAMLDAIREGCPMPKKQLFDSIGLELEQGETV